MSTIRKLARRLWRLPRIEYRRWQERHGRNPNRQEFYFSDRG